MMRAHSLIAATAFVVFAPFAAAAQPPGDALSLPQLALGCAPPPASITPDAGTFRVIGAQDSIPRTVFDERDLILIDGGTAKGMQLGQEYYVRRPVSSGAYNAGTKLRTARTLGWIRLIAANETTAIASVVHACDFLQTGDYLEPFVTPIVPAEAASVDRTGELNFATQGRILFGEDERSSGGPGDFMMIDQGADQGMAPGARFAIYRDVRMWMKDASGAAAAQLPLAAIGEGVVVTIGPKMSVVKILAARDAVQRGDFVIPRKK